MKYVDEENGRLELHLCDDPDRFVEVAKMIQEITKGEFLEKVDGLEQSYWDLMFEDSVYTIHREHYLGVSIFSSSNNAKKLFEKIQRELTL